MSFVGGIDWSVVIPALRAWVVGGSGLPLEKVVLGEQDAPRPTAPAIIMRISNDTQAGRPWVDFASRPLTFADKSVTVVDVAANTLAIAAHGLTSGDGPVRVASTGTVPGGLAVSTDYWVIAPDADHVQLATTFVRAGGVPGSGLAQSPIDLTSSGAGTITLLATAATLRGGQEMTAFARGLVKVTLELRCHAPTVPGNAMAVALLNAIRGRCQLPSQRAILDAANIGLIEAERVRAIQGVRDALLFEPRAYLDVHLYLASEDSEAAPGVGSVQVTNPVSALTTIP